MIEYRDVHNSKEGFDWGIVRIGSSSMSKKQKDNISKFVEDLKIGKAGDKVKNKRINNYLQFLIKLNEYFGKDLELITEKEATQFYKDLQENKVKKQNGMPFSEASKDEYIKTLKRYLGWKWGKESKKYLTILRWMKTGYSGSDKKAINLKEVESIVNAESTIRNKALFMFLFDSGCRIEEALNVRISDLKPSKNETGYYIVHVRGQKTEESDRTIPIPLATKLLDEWLKEHPTKKNDDFIFPIEYDNARKIVKQMSNKVLKVMIKPHELRHSSATHYIQFGGFGAENIGGFYYRYGWKFGSKEALTYIKQYLFSGELPQERVVKNIMGSRLEDIEKENAELKARMELIEKALVKDLQMREKSYKQLDTTEQKAIKKFLDPVINEVDKLVQSP